jgi:type I restriction enzyme S subunit
MEGIDESTFAKISEKTHEVLQRSKIKSGDILVTIAGVYLGKIGLVSNRHVPANTNQAVAIVRLDKTRASPEFIKYFLLAPSTTVYLNMLCPTISSAESKPHAVRKLKVHPA